MAEATAVTAGAYDPTVLGPMVEAVTAGPTPWPSTPTSAPCRCGRGIPIDPGGIGKGLAADLVADQMIAAGAAAVAVVIGGDGRVRSIDGARRWTIDIAAPDGSAMIDRVEVDDAAVATSGCRRAHLVDPSTGELCEPGDVIQVSVLAGTGASAEALTKAVLVGGEPDIADDLDRQGVGVLAVHADGRLSANAHWRRHRCTITNEAARGVNEQLWWYLARSAGMAAAVLMVGALVLGVLAATRALKEIDRPAWLVALHRWFSVLTVDCRRDPPRRPRRRQLRPLRTRRVARAGDVVVAPARRVARGDRSLPVRRRARVVTGDEAPAQGVVAPAARAQLPVGVGGDHPRRHAPGRTPPTSCTGRSPRC